MKILYYFFCGFFMITGISAITHFLTGNKDAPTPLSAIIMFAVAYWFYTKGKKYSLKASENKELNENLRLLKMSESVLKQKRHELNTDFLVYKEKTEWDNAINSLKELKALEIANNAYDYFSKDILRLPLMLQQGGYFDEAIEEYKSILKSIETHTVRQNPSLTEVQIALLRNTIFIQTYGAMASAYKRAKNFEEMEPYIRLSEEYKQKNNLLHEQRLKDKEDMLLRQDLKKIFTQSSKSVKKIIRTPK